MEIKRTSGTTSRFSSATNEDGVRCVLVDVILLFGGVVGDDVELLEETDDVAAQSKGCGLDGVLGIGHGGRYFRGYLQARIQDTMANTKVLYLRLMR